MAKTTTEKPDKILLAAMQVAAEGGWRRLDLGDIAAAAKVSLADLRAAYPGKAHILAAINDYADRAVLAGTKKSKGDSGGESARDALFDVLMRRFDALKPFKDGIAAVARDGGGGGALDSIWGATRLMRSMAWMLEAAGIGSGGVTGLVRTKGLAVIYASVIFVWLRDDSDDHGKTMAALDRRLATAERIASWRLPRRARRDVAAEGDARA